MKKISLKEILKEEKYAHLVSNPIDIINIKIDKEKMELFMVLESSDIISFKHFNEIKKHFEIAFEKFNITLIINYKFDITDEKNKINYMESIKEYIHSLIPSSISWLDELSYAFNEDLLSLEFPNDISLASLKRKDIINKLKSRVENELGLDLETTKNVCNEYNDDFLENKSDEEKIISRTIVESYDSKPSKNNKKVPSKSYVFGKEIKGENIDISEINLQTGRCIIKGEIFNIDYSLFTNDFHIHFEEGSIPKDGPSAGVSIVTSLISTLKKMTIPNTVSMTGEITLRGKILPVGGLKEKLITATISNIKTVYVPLDNKEEVMEIDKSITSKLKIKYVDDYIEIYNDLFQEK